MNNRYILPVCFAVAAHGALLFGFTRSPRSMVERQPCCLFEVDLFSPPEEDPVRPEPDPSEAKAKRAPPELAVLPRTWEPPVIVVESGFAIPPPQPAAVDPRDILRVIETGVGQQLDGKGGSGWARGVLTTDHLDNVPRTRFQAAPMYPFQAKREGLRGEVTVEFIVDERGQVVAPRIVSSSHAVFEEATLRAIAKWRFEPGRRDGRIVRFRMSAPFVFSLSE